MSLGDLVPVLQDLHRALHEGLTSSLGALQDSGSPAALVSLVASGFLYGVLHAIGPGHGKVVIGAYMFADDRTLRQGLLITALSSLLQAVVAIALVLALFLMLGLAEGAMESAAAWMDCVSLALLAGVGMVLIVRGARFLGARQGISRGSRRGHVCADDHSSCKACGHAASAQQLRNVQGLRGMLLVVASVGLRPCSGALLLMTLACLTRQTGAGMLTTLAMGLGTGLSVSAIALAAVRSRKWVIDLAGAAEPRLATATGVASIFGGAAIIASAALLLVGALSPAASGQGTDHRHAMSMHLSATDDATLMR
jgi:ABC-type nickel/cobalt efflux system permease component RcnA